MPEEPPEVVVAPPEVDMDTSQALAERLSGIDPARDTVVDCSAIEFIDSSGLRVLVMAQQDRRRAGGSLRVTNVPESMRRLLDITDLRHLLNGDD